MLSYDERKQAQREKKEREEAEVKALFPQVVKQIAAAMGWSARFTAKNGEQLYRCYAYLESGSRIISISTSDYSPDFRLSISGEYDMGPSELGISWPYRLSRPNITVSMRRDAAAIAKDITTRFLPDYDAACAKIAEHIKQASDSLNSHRTTRDRLAKVAGVTVRQPEHMSEQFDFYKYYGKQPATGPRLEVKTSSNSATIELQCGVELAEAVIKAIEALVAYPNPNDYAIQRSYWSSGPAKQAVEDHEGEYLANRDEDE